MKLLPRILNRIAFIRMEFAPDGACRTDFMLWQGGYLTSVDRRKAKSMPTVLVACGSGVVTKPKESVLLQRVRADTETFLCCVIAETVSFGRRQRLQPFIANLAEDGIVPVRIFHADAGADFHGIANELARQLLADIHWRKLLSPAPESSAVLQALVGRIALPILGLLLALLVVNAILSPRFDSRKQAIEKEIAARERMASTASSTGLRKQKPLIEFTERPPIRRAVLCDLIGMAVPQGVMLTAMSIEPLTNRFEAKIPLKRRENRAFVKGKAPVAADITDFMQRLSELTCCRGIRLTGMQKTGEYDRLTFHIEITL